MERYELEIDQITKRYEREIKRITERYKREIELKIEMQGKEYIRLLSEYQNCPNDFARLLKKISPFLVKTRCVCLPEFLIYLLEVTNHDWKRNMIEAFLRDIKAKCLQEDSYSYSDY